MPKTDTPAVEDGPVEIATNGGPQFALDQMCDVLERARIDAQARTDDLSIRWGHGADDEAGKRLFCVTRDGLDPVEDLSVDEAKALLDGMGA